MNRLFQLGILLLGVVATTTPVVTAADSDREMMQLFENEIRPLLLERCVQCHGPKKSESGLRLDDLVHILRGGDSGPALKRGDSQGSLLIKALRHEDGYEMPPDTKLPEHQVAAVVKWVEAGAPWPEGMKLVEGNGPALRSGPVTEEERQFWSFLPIKDPIPPSLKDSSAARNPIDQFVITQLNEAGLKMRPPADKRTLLRRATFDLTGLPPTPEELDTFLNDDSEQAFDRVIERLLASPAYGERWGRHWLDVVRYADTAGETADYPMPQAYKYRNWVIRSFHRDLPFDQFLRAQLAGDLIANQLVENLPGEPDEEMLTQYRDLVTATGFIAISRRFGFDVENYHHLTIQDTIDTLGQAVLGITLGCARCHDHKFDPVSLRDYYAWYGIFESTRYSFPGSEEKKRPRDLIPEFPRPIAERLKAEREKRLAELAAFIEQRKEEIASSQDPVAIAGFEGFESQPIDQSPAAPYRIIAAVQTSESAQSPFTNVFPIGTRGVSVPANSDNNALIFALQTKLTEENAPKLYYNLDLRHRPSGNAEPGSYRIYLGQGPGNSAAVELSVTGTELFVRNGANYESVCKLEPGEWYNLQLTLDLIKRTYSGVLRSPKQQEAFADKNFVPGWNGIIDHTFIDRSAFTGGVTTSRDFDNLAVSSRPFLSIDKSITDPMENEPVKERPSAAQIAVWQQELSAFMKQRDEILKTPDYPEILGAVDLEQPADARLQLRGEPTRPGDVVPRGNLELLGSDRLPENAGSGRLQLAHWLTRPENPLTARVAVNRIWQHHFGRGIVRTENDFGVRGERPTHPELLDWLASRFIESGWSFKAMHRLMMSSAAYQQSSFGETADDLASLEKDPDARLLWRFNPRRLSAEEIRDAMLLVSGELDPTPGEAHPFPPVETWNFSQHGPYYAVYDHQKRSVYLMQQRLKRHPFLGLFDGADTNASTAHRQLTTVPTQALYLMNNSFVHNCAASLAKRVMQGTTTDEERLRQLYLLTLSRFPSSSELEQARLFLEEYTREIPSGTPEQKQLAAWSALGRTLLIRNEFLFVN